MSEEEDDGSSFGGRGDEVPYYPSLLTPEWMRRMRAASLELRRAEAEIHEHCAKINAAVTQIFRELESQ